MPRILVLKQPHDKIYDELERDEDELGETVEDLYEKLNPEYSIEVRYD